MVFKSGEDERDDRIRESTIPTLNSMQQSRIVVRFIFVRLGYSRSNIVTEFIYQVVRYVIKQIRNCFVERKSLKTRKRKEPIKNEEF